MFRIALRLAIALFFMASTVKADVTVFAAASLKGGLDDAAEAWTAKTGTKVRLSFAGSSALARQILQGAPADLFISASTEWMDVVEADGLLAPITRHDLFGNRLVLIAHGEAEPITLTRETDMSALLGENRLAMALVDAVPAGIYGKAALEWFGYWPDVRDRIAQTDNVRAALALVAWGEAPFGIVYATDAAAEPKVSVVATFPLASHPPIVYPAARLKGAGEDAAEFLEFLSSSEGAPFFEARGFAVHD